MSIDGIFVVDEEELGGVLHEGDIVIEVSTGDKYTVECGIDEISGKKCDMIMCVIKDNGDSCLVGVGGKLIGDDFKILRQ